MKVNKNPNARDSGIELLRIFIMLLLVMHHLNVHGGLLTGIETLPNTFGTYQKLFFESFLLFPVSCFVFISGYFGIKLKTKKVASILIQALFYSSSILAIFYFISPERLSWKDFIMACIPISSGIWWFISTYFFLMLLSPVINHICYRLSEKMFKYLLLIGVIINLILGFAFSQKYLGGNGSTLVNFVFIYFLARYYSLYKIEVPLQKLQLLLIYIGCSLIIFSLSVILYNSGLNKHVWSLYQFNNPLTIISGISIFLIFKRIKFSSASVNGIAASILGVYLIHSHYLVNDYIYAHIFTINEYAETWYYALFLFLFSSAIFAFCILVDKIRFYLTNPLTTYVLEAEFINLLDSKIRELSDTKENVVRKKESDLSSNTMIGI